MAEAYARCPATSRRRTSWHLPAKMRTMNRFERMRALSIAACFATCWLDFGLRQSSRGAQQGQP
jgi:hypothetical protein